MPIAGDADGPLYIGEGSPITASATATGPAPYTFDWSLTQGGTTLHIGSDPTFNFVVPDDANVTIHLNLTDANGQVSSDSFDVIVSNVAPSVTLDEVDPISENDSTTITGSYTDPGVLDSQTLIVDWADLNDTTPSTFEIPALKDLNGVLLLSPGDTFNSTTDLAVLTITSIDANTGTIGFSISSHQYLDDGEAPGDDMPSNTSSIKVTVTDENSDSGSDTTDLIVNNEAPTVELGPVADISENGSASITGSYTDVGVFDAHKIVVNWADPNDSTPSTFEVPARKDTAGMVTLQMGDTFNSTTDLAVLTITAVDPLTGKVSFSISSHQYLDDGPAPGDDLDQNTSMIQVTVTDDDTEAGSDVTNLVVKNLAPVIVLDSLPDIGENGSAVLTGSYTDVGVFDAHKIVVDWADENDTTPSTFMIPARKDTAGMVTLQMGDTFNSTTDTAVLTIVSVNAATGEVKFSISSHQYLDDGKAPGNDTTFDISNVKVTISDDDKGTATDDTDQRVNNAAPTVLLNATADITENGSVTLTGSYTDIGVFDAHRLEVNWADPNDSTPSIFEIPSRKNTAGMVTLNIGDTFNSTTDLTVLTIVDINDTTGEVKFSISSHQYLDDGEAPGNDTTFDISKIVVTVSDDDKGIGTDDVDQRVDNVVPTVVLDATSPINENGAATITGSYTDIGVFDAHRLEVNWADLNDSTPSVFNIPSRKDTAGMVTLSAGDTFASTTDSAVLTIISVNATTGKVEFSISSHQYLDDGEAPGNDTPFDISKIIATVTDDDSGVGSDDTDQRVDNVAPEVTLGALTPINENDSVTLSGSYTDPGVLDAHTITVNWADPNDTTPSIFELPSLKNVSGMLQLGVGDTFNSTTDLAVLTITDIDELTGTVTFTIGAHQYLDDGIAPGNDTPFDISAITLTVADDDMGADSDSKDLRVDNVVPVVVLNAVPAINENGTTTLTGSYTDIGVFDAHQLVVNWNDLNDPTPSTFNIPSRKNTAGMVTLSAGDTFNSTTDDAVLTITEVDQLTGKVSFSISSHQYLDDGPAPGNGTDFDISNIVVTVTDDDKGIGADDTDQRVDNVEPVVVLNPVTTINENGTATLTGTFTDIGRLDRHSMTINWGDLNDSQLSTFDLIPAIIDSGGSLFIGQTFMSTTDEAVLTITDINAATGQVTFSVQHQYLDDGPAPGNGTIEDTSTITVTVKDDDLGAGVDMEDVLVRNVEPAVQLNPVTAIDENGIATLTGTITDIGRLDRHSMVINWGDLNDTQLSTFQLIPAIIDSGGSLFIGQTFNSTTDEAVLTITGIIAATGQITFSVQHQYLDDGPAPGNGTTEDTSTITVTVSDDDLGTGVGMGSVLVRNVVPLLALNPVTTISENGLATLTGRITDIGRLDRHSMTINWGDPNDSRPSTFLLIPAIIDSGGSLFVNQTIMSSTDGAILTITSIDATLGEITFSVQHQYLDDGQAPGNNTAEDISTITVSVNDDDLGAVMDSETVLVRNVIPVLNMPGNQEIFEGSQLPLANVGTFTDVGTLDRHMARINWGDGHIEDIAISELNGSGSVVGNHTYADDGTYIVIVRIADDDMGAFANPTLFFGNSDGTGVGTAGIHFVENTFTVIVRNTPPRLIGTANLTINEGQSFTLNDLGVRLEDLGFDNPLNPTTPTLGDPLRETFAAFSIDWGDGRGTIPVSINNAVPPRIPGSPGVTTKAIFTHGAYEYADDGLYIVTIRVADDNMAAFSNAALFTTGVAGTDFVDLQFTIRVRNLTPTLAMITPQEVTIDENQSVSFTANFSDPGFNNLLNPNPPEPGLLINDTQHEFFRYYIDWRDSPPETGLVSVADVANLMAGGPTAETLGNFGGTHLYADDGRYEVIIRLADDNMPAFTDVSRFVSGSAAGFNMIRDPNTMSDVGAYVEVRFIVNVRNVAPSFLPPGVPLLDPGDLFGGTNVTSTGFASIIVNFSDPGFDNTLNPLARSLPNLSDPRHESFSYVIDWGDGTVDAIHNYIDPRIATNPVIVTVAGPGLNGSFNFANFGFTSGSVLTIVSSQVLNTDAPLQAYTYTIDWGNGTVQTFQLMLTSPGAPALRNQFGVPTTDAAITSSLPTTVNASARSDTSAIGDSSGSFMLTHRYFASPNPNNPTAPIPITAMIIDDNNGLVMDTIVVENPGIDGPSVLPPPVAAIPRLEFVPNRLTSVFLQTAANTLQSVQNRDTRVVRGDQNLTSDVYLELRVVTPDGEEMEPGYRLPDDALQNLRKILSRLPDNKYRIYLIRTENNSRRLVMEVVVRGGRVVDPSDDSEGTRDRPPQSEQNFDAVPLDQNEDLQPVPQQDRAELPGLGKEPAPVSANRIPTIEVVRIGSSPNPPPPAPSPRYSMHRWAAPLVGVGLTAMSGDWSKQLEAALESADGRDWQRLRRAGRLGRLFLPSGTPNRQQTAARREYNESCS